MNKTIIIKACVKASMQLLTLVKIFQGWNLISKLYQEPTEMHIKEISTEACYELAQTAQLILLGAFMQLSDKPNEYNLIQSAIEKSFERIDELSKRCADLIQKDDVESEANNELTALLHPVLTYMAEAGIANITIKQCGKESC